jgi:trk system potassium uptake protein TrkA
VSLADLEIPRDATVVAVVRRERLVVPRGDTVLEPGDEVLALVMGQSEQAVQAVLVGN